MKGSKKGATFTLEQGMRMAKLHPEIIEQLNRPVCSVSRPVVPSEPRKGQSTQFEAKEPKMSHSEKLMEAILERRLEGGDISRYEFESIKLKVGTDTCWYNPDFDVWDNHNHLTLIECKGARIWDDAIVKFKSAKLQYPQFSFEMWQWKNREFQRIL